MLFRRAQKGRLDLFGAAQNVAAEMLAPAVGNGEGGGPMAEERRLIDHHVGSLPMLQSPSRECHCGLAETALQCLTFHVEPGVEVGRGRNRQGGKEVISIEGEDSVCFRDVHEDDCGRAML